MNGKRYQIYIAPSAYRRYKRFIPSLQQKVREEAEKLSQQPYHYQELKSPLKGIRSYHFRFENVNYRIAYRVIEEERRVEIVLVKTREKFYETLRQIT